MTIEVLVNGQPTVSSSWNILIGAETARKAIMVISEKRKSMRTIELIWLIGSLLLFSVIVNGRKRGPVYFMFAALALLCFEFAPDTGSLMHYLEWALIIGLVAMIAYGEQLARFWKNR